MVGFLLECPRAYYCIDGKLRYYCLLFAARIAAKWCNIELSWPFLGSNNISIRITFYPPHPSSLIPNEEREECDHSERDNIFFQLRSNDRGKANKCGDVIARMHLLSIDWHIFRLMLLLNLSLLVPLWLFLPEWSHVTSNERMHLRSLSLLVNCKSILIYPLFKGNRVPIPPASCDMT